MRKKLRKIAREIGEAVHKDCLERGFSAREAKLWQRVFRARFLPSHPEPSCLQQLHGGSGKSTH
jgi:hypothetical protein